MLVLLMIKLLQFTYLSSILHSHLIYMNVSYMHTLKAQTADFEKY